MQAPKTTPRFLPTLTEVVKPAATVPDAPDIAPAEVTSTGAHPDEALVNALVQRLLPDLEQRMQTALRESLQAQWEAVLPHVMAQLEDTLRDMAAHTVKSAQNDRAS